MEHFRCFGLAFFLSILSAIAIASEETPDLHTESTSEFAATNSTNSLKDGLESFTHTLTHPRGRATTRWDKDTLTLTSESAERRTSRRILDAEGRPLRLEVGSFEPVNYEHDARSRPVRVTQGTREQSLT